jgi:hypothetical protein
MRVFAVAQRVDLLQHHSEATRVLRARAGRAMRGHVLRDRSVVARGVRKRFSRELGPKRQLGAALHGAKHAIVIGWIHDHGHTCVILGCAAQHRRSADVDVLDHFVVCRIARDRRGKRIQVDNHEVDRLAADAAQLVAILRELAHQNPTVHAWMQRFDAALHDLGRTGIFGDIGHRNTC